MLLEPPPLPPTARPHRHSLDTLQELLAHPSPMTASVRASCTCLLILLHGMHLCV
jgi:hypothetical protein